MFLRCGRVEIFLYHFNVTDGRAFGKSTDVLCLVAQSCPTLCDPIDYSPLGSSVHGDSPGKNTGVGCHALLQGISQPRDQTQVSHLAGKLFTL